MKTHATHMSKITLRVDQDCLYSRELIMNMLIHSLHEYPSLRVKDETGEEIDTTEHIKANFLQHNKDKKFIIYSQDTVICEMSIDTLISTKAIDNTLAETHSIILKFSSLKTYDIVTDEESLICLYTFAIELNKMHLKFSVEEIGLAVDTFFQLEGLTILSQKDGAVKTFSSYLQAIRNKNIEQGDRTEFLIAVSFANDRGLDIHSIIEVFEQYNVSIMTDHEKDVLYALPKQARLQFLETKAINCNLYDISELLRMLPTIRHLDMSLIMDSYELEPKGYFT